MDIPLNLQVSGLLQQAIEAAQAAGDLPAFEIPTIKVDRPKFKEQGDYASGISLSLARPGKKAPLQIAGIILKHLPHADFIDHIEVIKPGFVNIFLAPAWLKNQVGQIIEAGSRHGWVNIGKGERVQVEFVSANPTGPLTIGSARNAVYGDTLARVYEAAGYDVQREYYVNDLGSKVRKMGRTLLTHYAGALGRSIRMPEEFYPGVFLEDLGRQIAGEYGSTYLDMPEKEAVHELGEIGIRRTLAAIEASLSEVNIKLDNWFSERSLYEDGTFERVFDMLKEKGYIFEKDNATWFKASAFGLEQDAVVIRSAEVIPEPDARPTYLASDIAYVWNKIVDRNFSKAVYVWGADHQGDKPRVLAAMQALGLDPARVEIILYQLVTLLRDGQEVRMSKSSGEYVTMTDVVHEVGADALRFMLISASHDQHINFDLGLVLKQSSENPVFYVQYAHARICSILRKAEEEGYQVGSGSDFEKLYDPAELELIKKMVQLPEIVSQAVRDYSPHYLPHFAQDLAATFHLFYRDCRVIDADAPELTSARLGLVNAARIALANTLDLMGMTAPERM
ncbi:MAG: arginine--tRNA ligase [Chloroflexi bacterium]|nr:arginine--tRNA ligase [Chloroflexota bacterium]